MKKVLVALGLLMAFGPAFSYTLEISEEELQSRLTEMMPMEHQALFVSVVLSSPDIDLTVGNNEIGFSSNVEVVVPGGLKGTGSSKVTGSLSYEPSKGAFYVSQPKIVDLKAENVPPQFTQQAKEIAQVAVSQFLSTRPIFVLSDKDLKQQMVKAVLKSVKVENNLLLVELDPF